MTPFRKNDILSAKQLAESWAREFAAGAVTVLIAVAQRPGLPTLELPYTVREL